MKDIGVHIVYRNSEMRPIADELYTLDEYATIIRNDLLRMISDVEALVYESTGGCSKDRWTDETWVQFCKVKHKLLDKAGEIGRLPANLVRITKDGGENGQTHHQEED